MELVIASTNIHKIRELREMLKGIKGFNLDVLTLHHFPQYAPLPEDGPSLQDICKIKAEHAAKTLDKWVLADDSALFVPALGNVPGIHSKRYAGEDATDMENRQKLLKAMLGLVDEKRHAYCECCLAIASPEGIKKIATGTCEGFLLTEEKGRGGFGYDPLFVKHEYDKTFSEIEEGTKNRISHRRKAFEKLIPLLETLCN
jgi:XTP/dITP diphosphohydrolase